jgi:hypothetical protein
MRNPYKSPNVNSNNLSVDVAQPRHDFPSFFAWYFGAFIFSAVLWHLSGYFRAFDFLELPMIAFHFPLAGFLEPRSWMVKNQAMFFYALAFWGTVVPLAVRVAPERTGVLRTALGIIVASAAASIIYSVIYNYFGLGQIA